MQKTTEFQKDSIISDNHKRIANSMAITHPYKTILRSITYELSISAQNTQPKQLLNDKTHVREAPTHLKLSHNSIVNQHQPIYKIIDTATSNQNATYEKKPMNETFLKVPPTSFGAQRVLP